MAALGRCLPVQRVLPPSVADFHRFFVRPMLPVILAGVALDWPAVSRWRDEAYLHASAGDAMVDVEVGSSFLDPELQLQRNTLSGYMRQHMREVSWRVCEHTQDAASTRLPLFLTFVTLLRRSPLSVMLWQDVKLAPQRVGYVAHYDLFAAAPLLRKDITVPPCVPLFSQRFIVTSSRYVGSASNASLPLGRAQLAAAAQSEARRKLRHYHSITPAACELHGCWDAGAACPSSDTSDSPAAAAERVFAWFGPSGTYSPLHHDPWHNLLVQVVGRKRVRCYAPCSTPALYPFPSSHAHGTRTACSTVTDHDAACPAKYPLFAAAPQPRG